jgi:uncharacterized membrane protein YheB (UPF0754 family)
LLITWQLIAPPLFGSIIGYFTNDIAIRMLFRPYRAIYLWGQRLPFTPGLIPANQERLAKRVSDTIMGSLLTPDELHKLARKLLETDRTKAAIQWLLELAVDQAKADPSPATTKILANILRDATGESLPRLMKALARKDDFFAEPLNQLFDQVLLNFELDEEKARQLAEWILKVVAPPDTLRLAIIDFLSDRNIQVIDSGFREQASGTYWVVANLFGLQNALGRLRDFCAAEPNLSNARINEIVFALGLRNRLQIWLQQLSLQNLPLSTVRQLRTTVQDSVRDYLQDQGQSTLKDISRSVDWESVALLIFKRLKTSEMIGISLNVISEELAVILDRYLEQDLETIMEQVLPILDLDQVIIERVKATSPEDLEAGIQGIVRSELQAIVNLGGILGLLVGLGQSLSLLLS